MKIHSNQIQPSISNDSSPPSFAANENQSNITPKDFSILNALNRLPKKDSTINFALKSQFSMRLNGAICQTVPKLQQPKSIDITKPAQTTISNSGKPTDSISTNCKYIVPSMPAKLIAPQISNSSLLYPTLAFCSLNADIVLLHLVDQLKAIDQSDEKTLQNLINLSSTSRQ